MAGEMKTYELKEDAGPHKLRGEDADGNPMNHAMQPGEQVKSAKPLNKLFPNKFICVDEIKAQEAKKAKRGPLTEPVRPSAALKRAVDPDDEDDEEYTPPELYDGDIDHESTTDDEAEEKRAAKKAQVKAGKQAAAKMTPKERRRLAKKGDAPPVDDSKEVEEEADDDQDTEDDGVEKWGKDVTEDTDGATEKDLKVFFKDKHYQVFDADDLESPLTAKPLTETKAKKFVKDYSG